MHACSFLHGDIDKVTFNASEKQFSTCLVTHIYTMTQLLSTVTESLWFVQRLSTASAYERVSFDDCVLEARWSGWCSAAVLACVVRFTLQSN